MSGLGDNKEAENWDERKYIGLGLRGYRLSALGRFNSNGRVKWR